MYYVDGATPMSARFIDNGICTAAVPPVSCTRMEFCVEYPEMAASPQPPADSVVGRRIRPARSGTRPPRGRVPDRAGAKPPGKAFA